MRKKISKSSVQKAKQQSSKCKKEVRFVRLHIERNAQEGIPLAINGAAVGGKF